MSPAETMRVSIADRSHRIGSLLRAADLVMNQGGEPDPKTRADIALDLMSCAQEHADLISDTADALERFLIPA